MPAKSGGGVSRYILTTIAIACAAVLLARCAHIPTRERVFDISNDSVIAFGPDASHEDFEELNELAIAQDDFVTSWSSFAAWAEDAGVHVETSAPHFTVEAAGITFRVQEADFGYLLVEPSGRQKLIRGVQTDSDLILASCEFFTSVSVRAACSARQ